MTPRLIFSHRIDQLASLLSEDLALIADPFVRQTILVPNREMKRWLLIHLAKKAKEKVVLGIHVLTVQEALREFLPKQAPFPSFLQLFFLLYSRCSENREPKIAEYLKDDPRLNRKIRLCEQLASQFLRYGEWGDGFGKEDRWQEKWICEIFEQGPWKLPSQILPKAEPLSKGPLFCFCLDPLSDIEWAFFLKAKDVSVYHFSPCRLFWSDLASGKDQKWLERLWKKRGATEAQRQELSEYLKESHPLLASWGKAGKKALALFDQIDCITFEAYPPPNSSLLGNLQKQILELEKMETIKIDSSLEIIQAGASYLREVEILKDHVLQFLQETGASYCDIGVYAPNLDLYIPFIPFVFDEIPTAISNTDESSLVRGVVQLLELALGRFDKDDVKALFVNPLFSKGRDWDLNLLFHWIEEGKIRWGFKKQDRGACSSSPRGSWEEGMTLWIKQLACYSPGEGIDFSDSDLLAELIELLHDLNKDLALLLADRTLKEWSSLIERLAKTYFSESEGSLQSFLAHLQKVESKEVVPLHPILHLLKTQCKIQRPNSNLNAVSFFPLERGTVFPAKAIFVLGMGEEAFPRRKDPSSLDLPSCAITKEEEDRFLFLQLFFAANEKLTISYLHISAEGRNLSPSLVLQELMSYAELKPKAHPPLPISCDYFDPEHSPLLSFSQKSFRAAQAFYSDQKAPSFWPKMDPNPNVKPLYIDQISLRDLCLLTRHPWKFFLQKGLGIYLQKEAEDPWSSFTFSPWQKQIAVRHFLFNKEKEMLNKPLGVFGDLALLEVEEKVDEIRASLDGLELSSLPFSYLTTLSSGQSIQIKGEIPFLTQRGVLHLGEDTLTGVLRIWPEVLAVYLATGCNEILFTNGKKPRVLSFDKAEESLKLLLEYYLRCISAPSPLIQDWADSLLRRGPEELAKKMAAPKFKEDPTVAWVLSRADLPSAEELFQTWSVPLRKIFAPLIALYPTRRR